MKKIKETLWADYDDVSEKIKCLSVDNEKYVTLLEERDKIRNELIKFEQSCIDREIKTTQIETENKRDKVRNQIVP